MKSSFVFALSTFTFLTACAVSPTETTTGSDGAEQDLVASHTQLNGAWVRASAEAGGFGSSALYLGPDGTFFQDAQPILLGVMTSPPKASRGTGTYAVNATAKTLTLKFEGGATETYRYDYTPMNVILGVFAPGSSPPAGGVAKLSLTRQGAPGSQIAFPVETFQAAASYCQSDADCDRERTDKSWDPATDGASHCQTGADARDGEEAEVNLCATVAN